MKKVVCRLPLFIVFIAFFLFSFYGFNSNKKVNRNTFVGFYNVENLFDTLNDPHKNDDEFTPLGKRQWNTYKYKHKLAHTARVLQSINGFKAPTIMGLCEVENRRVLDDLVTEPALRAFDLQVIHQDSPDRRGIDVAALYDPHTFTLVHYLYFKVRFAASPHSKTRDILYIKGIDVQGDTIHVFYNHWPSRRGGEVQSEPKRIEVAFFLKSKIDSVLKICPRDKVLVLGDFNDEPSDRSMKILLNESSKNTYKSMFNIVYEFSGDRSGTCKYKKNWFLFDQILANTAVFESIKKLNNDKKLTCVFAPSWLLEEDKKYAGDVPFRTYEGLKFTGGYSDHLPVFVRF